MCLTKRVDPTNPVCKDMFMVEREVKYKAVYSHWRRAWLVINLHDWSLQSSWYDRRDAILTASSLNAAHNLPRLQDVLKMRKRNYEHRR